MIDIIVLFVFCTVLSLVIVHYAINLAQTFSVTDDPGEHKLHDLSTPFVGGTGIFVAICAALAIEANAHSELVLQCFTLGLCAIIIFITGFADDIRHLSYKLRFVIQAVVALIMILAGGVLLNDLGDLFFGLPLQLGIFAIPFTIFAVIGGINAFNMIDGIDGLLGSVALVTLLLIGAVAFVAGDLHNTVLATALAGGVIGFLYFNLRYPSQSNARVFLGDNGSMLIGFLIAWLLIDLSQGSNPAIQPVAALWLLSIPIMDTISVMHRRIRMGRSPFTPDHSHLHHILLSAGFRVEEVVFAIATLHFLLGIIGITGLYLGIPEFIMLLGFLLVYLMYFTLTLHPQRFMPTLRSFHTRLGLASAANSGIFQGGYTTKDVEKLIQIVSKELGAKIDYWVKVFEQQFAEDSFGKRYAIALNIRLPKDDHVMKDTINQYIILLQRRLLQQQGIQLRQFVARNSDRRVHSRRSSLEKLQAVQAGEMRTSDRRVSSRRFSSRRITAERRVVERHDVERRISNRRISEQHMLGSQVLVFEITHVPPPRFRRRFVIDDAHLVSKVH